MEVQLSQNEQRRGEGTGEVEFNFWRVAGVGVRVGKQPSLQQRILHQEKELLYSVANANVARTLQTRSPRPASSNPKLPLGDQGYSNGVTGPQRASRKLESCFTPGIAQMCEWLTEKAGVRETSRCWHRPELGCRDPGAGTALVFREGCACGGTGRCTRAGRLMTRLFCKLRELRTCL